MTLPELLLQLRNDNLFPVRVESILESGSDLVFIGTLNEFIGAAKAIQSPVVFVSTVTFSEEHFLLESPDSDDDDDDDGEFIDLCGVVPTLEKYKSRIGEEGRIDLSVPGPKYSLTFTITDEWMVDFLKFRSEALRLFRQALLEKRTQEEAADEEKTQFLLKNLRGLITDKDFVRLPTQRAMLAYALDDFPELEALDENIIRNEIQNLKAKIDAQGLRRR